MLQELELQSVVAELKQTKGEKASVQEDLRVTVAELKRLRQETAALKADHVDKKGQVQNTSEQVDVLQAEVELLKQENTRLTASSSVRTDGEVMKLQGKCRELETQLMAEKEWARSLEKEKTAGKSAGSGLEADLASMTQRAVNAEEARDQAYKEVMAARSGSTAEIRALKERNTQLHREVV